jgi:hypothetical protein
MDFDDNILGGVNAITRVFHSTLLENGPEDDEIYNNWNFTNNYIWDSMTNESFWYSANNTMIMVTEKYEIGQQAPQTASFNLIPQKFVFKNKIVKSYFPMSFEDEVVKSIEYSYNLNVNERRRTPNEVGPVYYFQQSMLLNFDYTERLFTINYVTITDIISRVGGYMAAFLPVLNVASPLMLIYFLYTLGDAIKTVKIREFFARSKDFLSEVKTKLQLILESN